MRLIRIFATSLILLTNLLVVSTSQLAQENAHRHHPRYKLIDLGAPISYGPVNELGSKLLNNEGVVSSYADTTVPDPLAAEFCYVPDCLVAHAFQ